MKLDVLPTLTQEEWESRMRITLEAQSTAFWFQSSCLSPSSSSPDLAGRGGFCYIKIIENTPLLLQAAALKMLSY